MAHPQLPRHHRDGIKIQPREFHFPKIRKYALSNVCELLCRIFVWDEMGGNDEFVKASAEL